MTSSAEAAAALPQLLLQLKLLLKLLLLPASVCHPADT